MGKMDLQIEYILINSNNQVFLFLFNFGNII
jgi:hypothetical protein